MFLAKFVHNSYMEMKKPAEIAGFLVFGGDEECYKMRFSSFVRFLKKSVNRWYCWVCWHFACFFIFSKNMGF